MISINTVDAKYFTLDGVKFPKIYQPLKQGNSNIGIYSIYDTKQQLVNSTKFDEFSINGSVYGSQLLTIAAILSVVWSGSSEYEVEQLQNRVNNLELNQYTGVKVYSTYASLPAVGTLLVSYKVSNDSTASNNGFFHWSGSAYVKDSDLAELSELRSGNKATTSDIGFTNAVIGSDGGIAGIYSGLIYEVAGIRAGDTIHIEGSLVGTGVTHKRMYAFYNSKTLSSASFISGGDALESETLYGQVTVPAGTVMMCITVLGFPEPIVNMVSRSMIKRAEEMSGVLNMDIERALSSGYYTLETAISAIDIPLRKTGLKICFNIDSSNVEFWTFTSPSVANFTFQNFWKKEDQIIDKNLLLTPTIKIIYQNNGIDSSGNIVGIAPNFRAFQYDVTQGEQISIKTAVQSTGGLSKRSFAFYNGTPASGTFISGSTASTDKISINKTVTVPAGAIYLVISTIDGQPYEVAKVNQAFLANYNKLKADFDAGQSLNINSSSFGVLENGQGLLQEEAEAFGGVWMNYAGNIRTYYISRTLANDSTITFRNTTDNTVLGILTCNFNQNFYSLHIIYDVSGSSANTKIIGYCLLNPFLLKKETYGLYYATFNNSLKSWKNFTDKKNIKAGIIVLNGDSLIALGSGFANYFGIQAGVTVTAIGSGGEPTLSILGRLGAIPFYVASAFTIPADTSAVSISLKSSWNDSVLFPNANFGLSTVIIRGIEGTLTVTSAGASCTFARTTAGTAVSVKSGEFLVSYSARNYKEQILVLWMGTNGGWSNADDLISQFKAAAEFMKNGNYLFMTPHINTSIELELKMVKEFGQKYINMRQWCVNYGLEESGITPTTADNAAIALGNCPPSLLGDGTHFVTAAKQAQAALIKRKLSELNYL